MSGWKIVPVEVTPKQEKIAHDMVGVGVYEALVAVAPEPDWEALANVAARAFRHAPAGDRTGAWIAALKAALGGAK